MFGAATQSRERSEDIEVARVLGVRHQVLSGIASDEFAPAGGMIGRHTARLGLKRGVQSSI